jgi:hypothetical protein
MRSDPGALAAPRHRRSSFLVPPGGLSSKAAVKP